MYKRQIHKITENDFEYTKNCGLKLKKDLESNS